LAADQRTEVEAGPVLDGLRLSHRSPFAAYGGRLASDDPSHPLASFLAHPLTLRVLSAIVFCIAWEWAGTVPISPAFPTFTATMGALWGMLADLSLVRAFGITLQPLAIGLVIATTAGISVGVAMGLSKGFEWFASPVFIIAQAAPLAALIPLIVFAYGIGLAAKTLVVVIMAMPVIVLNSFAAVRHTPTSLVEMGKSFLASRRQAILKVILPSASPVIFAGLRLGCAAGFIGAILAELLITPTGIGDLITFNRSKARYPEMYAAIFSIIVFSVLFIEALERAEIFVRPEKRKRS
jgi:ABC-type nitrate/sulfonate/bicarbonate transport system permease component